MDLADDIAYSLHDVEDFHRSGVLQFSPVSGEFRSWASDREGVGRAGRRRSDPGRPPAGRRAGAAAPPSWSPETPGSSTRTPSPRRWTVLGTSSWTVSWPCCDGRSDGRLRCRHRLQCHLDRRADRGCRADARPGGALGVRQSERTGLARHQVSVLKFVNQYFILERPDLAMLDRAEEQTNRAAGGRLRPLAGRPRRRSTRPGAGWSTWSTLRLGRTRRWLANIPEWLAGRDQRRRPDPDGPRPRHHRLRQQPHRRPGGGLRRPAERSQRAALDHGRSLENDRDDAVRGHLWPTGLPAGRPVPADRGSR